jgi:epoxyqueuosine reductase
MAVDKAGSSARSDGASLNPESVRALALEARFDEASVVLLPHSEASRDAKRYEQWVRSGYAGSMQYLSRADEDGRLLRAHVSTRFPWAQSAIVCFSNYNTANPRSIDSPAGERGWIARYAWSSRVDERDVRRPTDYHKVLLKRLQGLEARLHEQFGPFESRAYVDTGPIAERALATAAGLGWIGKNTCLIHPKLGSFGFLAALLTSLPVEEERTPKLVPDRCGSCRRCLDACPTDALFAPYQMDATRCISYLTIEHKGPIKTELMEAMGRQVFGCDICQDVCPWNSPRRAPITTDPQLEPRPELVDPALDWLASLDERDFEQAFNGSPVRRAGFYGMRRNIAVAMGNSGLLQFLPRLREWAGATDENLRAAARWALKKLDA